MQRPRVEVFLMRAPGQVRRTDVEDGPTDPFLPVAAAVRVQLARASAPREERTHLTEPGLP